ncbi:MAG TPA: hypothetical protein VJZ75_01165 [Candidatus Bathyarchaeia archaeon]|nr:hypothetical protein [Candidatus Bathyarchaeia archaeon]
MVFEIEPKDIEKLDPIPFASFLNRLIDAECSKLGFAPTQLKLSSQTMSAEGGIDGQIMGGMGQTDQRWIPPGTSIWQFRTGEKKTQPKELAKEAIKPDVLAAIKAGAYYVVAISPRCDKRKRTSREGAIKTALKRKKAKVSLLWPLLPAEDLARWASEHLAMLRLFNRPLGNSMRVEDWEKVGRDGLFEGDQTRKTIIEEIHKFTSQTGSPVDFRILGSRGVGKTRLVLEALASQGIRERVLYAQDPSCLPNDFWNLIRGNKNVSAIIVVDECEDDVATKLRDQAMTCEGLIRLITIDAGDRFLNNTLPNYVFLERLPPESIRTILKNRFTTLSPEQIDWIQRVTAGYVKLAVKCGETLAKNPDFDVTKLANTPGIREFLKKLIPDDKFRTGMQSLSLLTQVGFEAEVEAEGQTIASFSGLSWQEFKEVAERMHQQGLVGKKGRYRYVTPDLLADWLANDLWQTRSTDIKGLVEKLPTEGSKQAFFERAKDLGGDEQTREGFFRILSEQELPTIYSLDTNSGSKIMYTVALADPKLGLRTLESLISNQSVDQLQKFSRGRRSVIWALDYLKWFKDTFAGAALLLLALAEAENEQQWSNNATGIWMGMFRLHLGGTEVAAMDRVPILEKALGSESRSRRALALNAIAAAMSGNEIRGSGVEIAGARPVPHEWHPRTYGEIWEVYRKMLQLVDQSILDQDSVVSQEARKIVTSCARTLVTVGLAEEIIDRLEKLEPQNDGERRELRDAVRTILEYESKILKDGQKERLVALEEKLAGVTYHDRLRRWIAQWSFGDWRIQDREGGPPPQERVAQLAEEAIENPTALKPELDWLVSDEAHNVGFFGKRLGELDQNHIFLNDLVAKTRGHAPFLLGTYLGGRDAAGDEETVAHLLDQWTESDEQLVGAILVATSIMRSSHRNLTRILQLSKKGWLQIGQMARLVWTGWAEKLPNDALRAFLACLLADENKASTEAALILLERQLKSSPNETESLAPFAWQALAQESAVEGDMAQYYWGEVSKHYVQSDPLRLADTVLGLYKSQRVKALFHQNDEPLKALGKAAGLKPKEVWDRVAVALLHKDEASFRLQLGLKYWYVQLFESNLLLDWADKHKPDGPQILATLTLPSGAPLNELTRQLLIRYGRDEHIRNKLHGNVQTGTFTGSMTVWLKSKLEVAKSWAGDSDLSVRNWANQEVADLKEQVARFQQNEEEEII